jgi:hypothetical protein
MRSTAGFTPDGEARASRLSAVSESAFDDE